ncbi:hypothetical protein ES695_18835, partial [Candidatus Atribacteria bacterium 1244-E10-H5-B2]
MLIKRGANLGILLLVLFLLVGCAGGGITDPDEIKIHAIADSIKTAVGGGVIYLAIFYKTLKNPSFFKKKINRGQI